RARFDPNQPPARKTQLPFNPGRHSEIFNDQMRLVRAVPFRHCVVAQSCWLLPLWLLRVSTNSSSCRYDSVIIMQRTIRLVDSCASAASGTWGSPAAFVSNV